MKRLFTYMTMLAMAVACSELYGPEPTPIAPDTAAGVEITVSEVKDSSFTVTVTPSGEASYYSWLVDESPKAAALDSSALYSVSYESLVQGTAKWTAEATSTTFTVDGLTPNTTYQVYAVVGSPLGIPGSVAVKAVKTSDALNPELEDFKAADGSMTLAFSEPVYPGEGDVTLRVFARKTKAIFEDKEAFVYTVPADSIACNPDGTVVLSFAGELPGGAYFSACYPEGAFVDSYGNKVEALKSGFYTAEDGKSLAAYGIQGRNDFVPFELVDTLDVEVFVDPERVFTVSATDATLAGYGKGTSTVSYATPGKEINIDLVADETIWLDVVDDEVVVSMACPEVPAYGSVITFTIAEDAVQDIWGNSNAEVEYEVLLSFGYTMDDLLGEYTFNAISAQDGTTVIPGAMTIEESDDEEEGNFMITSIMGLKCQTPIYGEFDVDAGTLDIYGEQPFLTTVNDNKTPDDETDDFEVTYVFYTYNYYWLQLKMTETGVISSPNDIFGAYVFSGEKPLGWAFFFGDFVAQRTDEAAEASTSSFEMSNLIQLAPVARR